MTVFRSLLAASALMTVTPAHGGVHAPDMRAPNQPITQPARSWLGDGVEPKGEWNGPVLPDIAPAPLNKATPTTVPPCYGSRDGRPIRCASLER